MNYARASQLEATGLLRLKRSEVTKPVPAYLIPLLIILAHMAEGELIAGKAGASSWVETLLEATNAASEELAPVPAGCADMLLPRR